MPMRVNRSGGDVRVGALERGGPHPRGRPALGRGGLTRGAVQPSSDMEIARGGI
jgi:hypothetical protein